MILDIKEDVLWEDGKHIKTPTLKYFRTLICSNVDVVLFDCQTRDTKIVMSELEFDVTLNHDMKFWFIFKPEILNEYLTFKQFLILRS